MDIREALIERTLARRPGRLVECAEPGCGRWATPRRIYCEDHQAGTFTLRNEPEGLTGVVPRKRRGSTDPHPCATCGRPAIAGRLYCSGTCRGQAQSGKPTPIVIDGITATLPEHAKRLGIDRGTVYCRLRSGMSHEQALHEPVQNEMRRRRFGLTNA